MSKKIFLFPFLLFVLILIVFFYLLIIDRNPSSVPSNLLNKNIPVFTSESLIKNKKFISEEIFNDKITLVNFFASWCKPCRDEHKYIKLFSQNKKIQVVGINYKDDNQKVKEWLKKFGNPYTNVAVDKKGTLAIDWGVYGIPETFVVNSKGIIKLKHIGPINKKIYKKINLLIQDLEK
jgi:cytochrome c biogenesis protein CcmG, thiol:disulfide interchange protein DsbE